MGADMAVCGVAAETSRELPIVPESASIERVLLRSIESVAHGDVHKKQMSRRNHGFLKWQQARAAQRAGGFWGWKVASNLALWHRLRAGSLFPHTPSSPATAPSRLASAQ